VLDCSVALAWCLSAERSRFSEAMLSSLANTEVWVPALWWLEFPNALLVAERRGRISKQWRTEILQHAESLPFHVDPMPVSLSQISSLASRTELTTYDAAYLEVALRRRLPLASADKTLQAAARKLKHPVLS
jgi:predicted nucleic acid-binding protein